MRNEEAEGPRLLRKGVPKKMRWKGMMLKEEMKALKSFEKESNWLARNYEKVREEHLEKFVAIKDNKVIAESESISRLQNKLKQLGIDPRTTLVDFMLPKDVILFL